MAYFLGRDCEVRVTLEVPLVATSLSGAFVTGSATSNAVGIVQGTSAMKFASPLNISAAGAGEAGYNSGTADFGLQADLTGVDLSIGAMDEDITYFGKRSVTKAEIKKETTVSLTRKKRNSVWDAVFDQARNGCDTSGDFSAQNLVEPNVNSGYRLHVTLRTGSADVADSGEYDEVFSIPNCCITSHSTSVNADGVSEETLEFMSYVEPNVGDVIYTTATTTAEL